VRKMAYDALPAARNGCLKPPHLHKTLERLDFPERLHNIVIETSFLLADDANVLNYLGVQKVSLTRVSRTVCVAFIGAHISQLSEKFTVKEVEKMSESCSAPAQEKEKDGYIISFTQNLREASVPTRRPWRAGVRADSRKLDKQCVLPKEELRLLTHLQLRDPPHSLASSTDKLD